MQGEGRGSLEVDSATFYNDGERYDLITRALSGLEPVDFYRTQAMRYGSPVLELACGTGRLSIPIAQDGLDVVGLDASAQMLSLAERRTAGSGLKIAWIRGDMRNFDLGRRFRLIFVASNSFSHLYSLPEIEACLGSVRRHLVASGRFVVDVFNPALGVFVRPPDYRSPVGEYDDPRSGGRVAVSKAVRYDSASQISHETWYFRHEVTGEEESVPLNLRMFFPQEIDALLRYSGFRIERKYGDYEHAAFSDSSRKQIIVCTAADTSR